MRSFPMMLSLALLAAGCGGDNGAVNGEDGAEPQQIPIHSPTQEKAPIPQSDEVDREGLAWNSSVTAMGPKLSYGTPQTDDVRFMLRCTPGEGRVRVQIMPPVTTDRSGEMTIHAGDARRSLSADVTESGLGGLIVRSELPLDDLALRNFREGQPITAAWGDHRMTVAAGEGSGEIEAFFRNCKGR